MSRRPPGLMLAPLVDVVFILVIFLVLSARFVDQERLPLELPVSASGLPEATAALVLERVSPGRWRLEGADVPQDQLLSVLEAARGDRWQAVVLAPADCPLQEVVDAVGAARQAGFGQVAVGTQPPREGE